MPDLSVDRIAAYLQSLLGQPVEFLAMARLGEEGQAGTLKGYGYGAPLRIEFAAAGVRQQVVLRTVRPGPFGHEHMADRAQQLLWEHAAFGALPRHVRSLDVGGFAAGGRLLSLGQVEEFFALSEYVAGQGYFGDLERLQRGGPLTPLDRQRAAALCDYLVDIHRARGPDPGLYHRRLRELVGHGECIMGLTDSYPPGYRLIGEDLLRRIEHRCLDWRWRLRGRTHRLRQVHGDFHPWNILFQEGTEFRLLDRSRGEWGEPADDVTCLTINYLFFSLRRSGRVEGALGELFHGFWERYIERSGDPEILEVAAPFLAFRGLVLASPLWYPDLTDAVRRRLIAFVEAVLEAPAFDPAQVNAYLRA
jgi:hypothetical protein